MAKQDGPGEIRGEIPGEIGGEIRGEIVVRLDVLLAERDMTLTELAKRIGLTQANVSILKTGKARAIRFTTLRAICSELGCQPGDLLRFEPAPPTTL